MVLKGLQVSGEKVEEGENVKKAKKLKTKIVKLHLSSAELTGEIKLQIKPI